MLQNTSAMTAFKTILLYAVVVQVICTYNSFLANSQRLQEEHLRKVQIIVDKLARLVTANEEQSGVSEVDMMEAVKEIDSWDVIGLQYEIPKTLRCYWPNTHLVYQLIVALATSKSSQSERVKRLDEYYKLLVPTLKGRRVVFAITHAECTDDLVDSLSIGIHGQLPSTQILVWKGLADYENCLSEFNEIGPDPRQIDRITWLMDYLARYDVQILRKRIFPMFDDPATITETEVTMMRSVFTQSMYQMGFIMEDGMWNSIYTLC